MRKLAPGFVNPWTLALVAIGAAVAPAPAQTPEQIPLYSTAKVRMAPQPSESDEGGATIAAGNKNVTNAAGAQSETSIGVDPTNGLHVLTSVNDLVTTAAVYESFDAGQTFTKTPFNPPGFSYDTWIAFNANGDAFVAYENGQQHIAYKKNGQTAWTHLTFPFAGGNPDRDMCTVDNSPSSPFFGSVYIGYDDNGAGNIPYVLYSRDGFTNWQRSARVQVGNPTIGVNVATGPDGTVYATWLDYGASRLWTAASHDGGATFGAAHVVTNFRMNTSGFFISIPPQNLRGIVPFPMTAAATAGSWAGRLYAAYEDRDPGGSNTNIYVRFSDDGGTTWSAELKVNDDLNHAYHFHPAIAVTRTGLVGVAFYDTRRDATNRKTDRVFTFSIDGGATWRRNMPITEAQSDETIAGSNGNQYGDYQGISANPGAGFSFAWTDSRRPGAQAEDMFADRAPK